MTLFQGSLGSCQFNRTLRYFKHSQHSLVT